MPKIHRLNNENAGFINDVSDIIATEALKDPLLIPDLSKDKTLFIFSDYSHVQGRYKTYSYLITGRSSADYFNGIRKELRDEFKLENRRFSYKGLNDKIKLKALPAFLSCAGAMDGIVVTFAVSTEIKWMFAEQFIDIWPNSLEIKKNVLEELLRVIHFGALVIMTVFISGQNIVWFTDSDAIVANEKHERLFGCLAETMIRKMFLPDEVVSNIAFGLSEIDNGTLEIEDFISIPDLVAGAICETLDQYSEKGIKIASKIVLNQPEVKGKTSIINSWLGKSICPLKKFGVVFDKFGSGSWDFKPTFFSVKNPSMASCEITCDAKNAASYISESISFDIEDYIQK